MSSLPTSSVGVPGVTTPTEDDLSPGGPQVWQPLCVSRPSPSTQYHVVATASTLPLYPPPGLPSLHLGSSPPEDTYWGDVQALNPCVAIWRRTFACGLPYALVLLGNELLLVCAVLHSNRLLRPLYLRGRTFVGLCLMLSHYWYIQLRT